MNTLPLKQKTIIAIMAALSLSAGSANATIYAPWLTQIGISDAILSAANWGQGQRLGVVDTGIIANNLAFAPGQVSTSLSSCAAVTFRCRNGFVDDNGHGTAVAAIAAGRELMHSNSNYGGYVVAKNSVLGVATDANIISEKVLNAQGSAYSTDVANGVRKAADAGASVINVSITYGNTSEIVSAINYAAAKGAFIVWAGGNSSTALLNGASTVGLTPTAINHLVFAGSVNANNALSSFSNTPGSGSLVNTSGGAASYASRWAMAPGEAIVAPGIMYGPNALAYWSGTSMSTPIISGSLLLLESAWAILKTNGTAANLLLATTTDLGAQGTDSVFGTGLINLAVAFQPYGALTVTQANGQAIPVSGITGALISGGAFGGLPAVQSMLANYMAFDSYSRNFSVNLSGLIKTSPTAASINPLPTNVNMGPTVLRLAGGTELAYWQEPADSSADRLGLFGFNPETVQNNKAGYAMITDKAGTTTAFGHGVSAQFSYAKALYGDDDFAQLSSGLGIDLAALAQGGDLFAAGTRLADTTRIAFSWSTTPHALNGTPTGWEQAWEMPKASNLSIGITHKFDETFMGGVSLGILNENHGMLGSTYDAGSVMNLGSVNKTYSLGFTGGIDLDKNNSFLFEVTSATTKGAANGGGFFDGTTDIQSRSYGMTLMSKNLLGKNDRLLASVKQPLSVTDGQVGVVVPSIDVQGVAHFNTEWVSLAPTAREVDYNLSYVMPVDKNKTISIQAGFNSNMMNIAGNVGKSVGAVYAISF